MEAATPAARDGYCTDLNAALQLTLGANTGKTKRACSRTFGHWCSFTRDLGIDPSLSNVPDAERRLTHLLVTVMVLSPAES